MAANAPKAERYEANPGNNNEEAAGQLARQGFEYAKNNMAKYRAEDAELWELVTTVPRMGGVWPYVCFILNIVLPGTGTMICSCVGYPEKWSKTQLTIGVIQMLTAVYLVGWGFSIWWGWLMLKRGLEDKQEVQQFLNRTNAKSEGGAA